MAQGVDPTKVIQKLAIRMANEIIQSAANEVALEEAQAVIAKHETPTAQSEG